MRCFREWYDLWIIDTYLRKTPATAWTHLAMDQAVDFGLLSPDLPEAVIRRDLCNLRIGASTALYLDFRIGYYQLKLDRVLVKEELFEMRERIEKTSLAWSEE